MKITILIISLAVSFLTFSQSKKVQIEILDHKIDSLTSVITQKRELFKSDKQSFEENIAELNSTIQNLKLQSDGLDESIKKSLSQIKNFNDEIKGIENNMAKVKDEIEQLKKPKVNTFEEGVYKNYDGYTLKITNVIPGKSLNYNFETNRKGSPDCSGIQMSGTMKLVSNTEAWDGDDEWESSRLYKKDGFLQFEPSESMVGSGCQMSLDVEFKKN